MKKTILLIILGVILASCSPEQKYASELTEISELKTKLDSIESLSQSINFDSVMYIKNSALEYERLVKKYYTADTVSQDFASKMTMMKKVRKSLKMIEVNKSSIENELLALHKQINDLDADVRNGVFNGTQIEKYLGHEKMALNKFELSFKSIYDNINDQKKTFEIAQPTIAEYINLIKPRSDQN